MSAATGVGSMPGEDFGAAVRLVARPAARPSAPARAARPRSVRRPDRPGVAITGELGFDLQPAGWRLTDAPGVDHRRARSLLAQDLDVLEEQTQGYAGPLKVQVAGPWTLASTIEKPRGDKVLSDHGARRELAQALAEGVRLHLADVQRRVPGARSSCSSTSRRCRSSWQARCRPPRVQPAPLGHPPAGAGVAGVGPRRQPAMPPPWCTAAPPRCRSTCCAGPGAGGVSVDLAVLGAAAYEELATAIDEGARVFLGVVPSTGEFGSVDQGDSGARAAAAGHARASTGKRSPTRWCSRRRAGWPARARRTRRVRWAPCGRPLASWAERALPPARWVRDRYPRCEGET